MTNQVGLALVCATLYVAAVCLFHRLFVMFRSHWSPLTSRLASLGISLGVLLIVFHVLFAVGFAREGWGYLGGIAAGALASGIFIGRPAGSGSENCGE